MRREDGFLDFAFEAGRLTKDTGEVVSSSPVVEEAAEMSGADQRAAEGAIRALPLRVQERVTYGSVR